MHAICLCMYFYLQDCKCLCIYVFVYDCTYVFIYLCVHVLVNVHVAKCVSVVPVGIHVVEEKVEKESCTGNARGDIKCFPGILGWCNSAVHVDKAMG